MKRGLFALGLTILAPLSAGAQQLDPGCTSQPIEARDVCQKSADLFAYMMPQLGTAVAGGSAVLGKAGVLGGLGHFSVGARVNLLGGSLPQIGDVQPVPTGAVASSYATEDQLIPMPVVDAAVGLFKGVPLGVTRFGGVDLLVNVAYIPDVDGEDVSISATDGNVEFGYGIKIGLIQESLITPAVAVSVMQRNLPAVTLAADAGTTARIEVRELDVETTAWRVTAGKNFLVFGLLVGAGQDYYDARATATGTLIGTPLSAQAQLERDMTRTTFFADITANVLLLQFIGEVGVVTGGDLVTYNQFDTAPDARRLYGSVGVRVGL